MAIKHSETHFGQAILDKFSGVLSTGLSRVPLLGVDVFCMLGSHDDIELWRVRSESLAKAVANGQIGTQPNIIAGQESQRISKEGLMDFIVYCRNTIDLDEDHYNMAVIEQGLELGTYNNGEQVRSIKATPVVLSYTFKYFTTSVKLVDEFSRQWISWRSSEYVVNFNIAFENPDGSFMQIPISCQFEIGESPQIEGANRYSNSLFYTLTTTLRLHTLMIEEAKEYIIQSITTNIYNDLPEPILLSTIEVTDAD